MSDSGASKIGSLLVGYFPSDAIHTRNYHVTDIPAAQLTHVIYAFANVSNQGECVSVNETDDQVNFPQLVALKKKFPKLRTLISIGGAAHSAHFAHAAATQAARLKFARSCVHFMTTHGFDGIDIDWEFPAAKDRAHYTSLLAEIRRLLNQHGHGDKKKHSLLTISAPAGHKNYANIDLGEVSQYLDWINLMAYDFTLPTSKTTNFDAPLYPPSDDPAQTVARLTHNVDAAVKAYLEAEVPAEKLVVGVHFIGTGWQGVAAGNNNGLYQSNTGPGPGTYEPGRYDYKDLQANYLSLPAYARHWHTDALVPWLFNPATGIMISYDDPESLTQKTNYVIRNQLGGLAVWQLGADDSQNTLLTTIAALILPGPNAINLTGANLTATVLVDLQTESNAQSFISDTLNAALKSLLVSAATQAGQTVLVSLLQALPTVDIASVADMTLQAFVTAQVTLPTDPTPMAAAQAAIAQVSTTTTVGDLLGLNTTLEASPLFAGEVKKVGLATLLATSPALTSNSQLINTFISTYVASKGPISNFWNGLSQNATLKAVVPELQLTMQLGTLTLDNPPLVAAIRANYPNVSSPRDLATLSVTDWQNLITNNQITVPASITGATPQEKITNYATSMSQGLAKAFPSVGFLQNLVSGLKPSNTALDLAVVKFLGNASGFDILNTNVNSYVAQNKQTAFNGIDANLQPAVTARIAMWQRLARVSSDHPTASALLAAGYASAYDIAVTPRASFIQKIAGKLGSSATAGNVHARAQQIAGTAMGLYSTVRQALSVPAVRAIGDIQSAMRTYLATNPPAPSWQTLFGPQTYCACTDCRSVYSAAAYFVDLLQFLQNAAPNAAGQSPYDVLIARRPDLPYIKLSCANTNTTLPYVDLVNEILEFYVVNGALSSAAAHDTPDDATASELSVSPEYTNDAAYNSVLNQAIFPPTLPFDRWLMTARTYLTFLGSSLYEVMTACQTKADASDFTKGTPSGLALACEYLNISQAECEILTGADFSGTPQASPPMLYQYYGYNSATVTNSTGVSVPWEQYVTDPITIFLQQMAIAYDDLVALLKTRALNATMSLLLQASSGALCDLSQTMLFDTTPVVRPNAPPRLKSPGPLRTATSAQPALAALATPPGVPSDSTLDHFHRFIRLWKKLGWAIEDLDKTMTALQATQIDQQFLVSLAAVQQLQSLLNLPVTTLLSFWANLDTDGSDSLYLSLFQNKAVLFPLDPAFQLIYVAFLGAIPTLQFPSPVFPNLVFDPTALTLTATAGVSAAELAQLQALSNNDPNLMNALTVLGELLLLIVLGDDVPFLAPLPALPQAALPTWLNYNTSTSQISFTGAMSDSQRQQLNFNSDVSFQTAVDSLYNQRTILGAELLGTADAVLASLVAPLHPLPISATATSLFVRSTAVIPPVPFVASIGSEQVLVTVADSGETARFGATWTVTRGYNDTIATTHNLGDPVFLNAITNHVNQIIAALRISAQDLGLIRSYTGLVDVVTSTLGGNIDPSATMIAVSSSTGFPAAPFVIGIGNELLNVTALSGTTWTVTRGSNGTTAASHNAGDVVVYGNLVPLNLANLSMLCRYAFLAQSLSLSVSDLITAIQVMSIDPFQQQDPVSTLSFVQAIQTLQASPFSIAQLNYLYRNSYDPNAGIAPLPANVSQLLTTLQAGLASIAFNDAIVPDPKGDLLLKAMGRLLGPSLASAALGLINGTAVYSAPLPVLFGVVIPPTITNVSYDAATQTLNVTGAMSLLQQSQLLALSPDPLYVAAVNALFTISQPGGSGTTYSQPLPALLSFAFPTVPTGSAIVAMDSAVSAISYDSASQQLRFTSPMTQAEQSALLTLSAKPLYQAAINNLWQQPISFINTNFAAFLSPADAVKQLIENVQSWTTAEKVLYVAQAFMPYLQQVQSKSLITQTLCDNLGLNPTLGGLLLNSTLISQIKPAATPPVYAMADFLALVGDGLSAAYYPNNSLSGTPFTRIDPAVNFDWGFGLPNVLTITTRPFSVRWTGFVMPQYSEIYRFYVKAGDRINLWVNGQPIVTQPNDQLPTELSGATTTQLTAGELYSITLEYYDDSAPAQITLSWSSPSTPKAVIPQSQLFSGTMVGDGLSAAYYPNNSLSGTPFTRIDPAVNFNWGFGLPNVVTITARPFSVRWTGFVMPQYSEIFTFYVKAGDRINLWVNGQPIVTQPNDQLPTELSGATKTQLTAGQPSSITLEYYDDSAPAQITLSWSSPSTPKAVIPQSQLFSGTIANLPNLIVDSYTLLYKAALLVNTFPLTTADVIYFSTNGEQFAGIDPYDPTNAATILAFNLNDLPLDIPAFTTVSSLTGAQRALFNGWQRLNAVVTLRNSLPGGDGGLLNIFTTASAGGATTTLPSLPSPTSAIVDPLTAAIVQATNWNVTDLIFLAGIGGFTLEYGDFTNEIGTNGAGLTRLQSCVALLTRLGISAHQLFSWASFVLTATNEESISQDIQKTAKSKYDDTTWVTVGKPLNDAIRESSKEALIAYILARAAATNMTAPDGTALSTSDQLYEFFLIDVDMSPCMLTSRIVQASAAIQLFVQRSLMNLEQNPVVSLSGSDAAEWEEWRMNFRVWQAARQVFLYPENWMVPTLRDDKTPFFEDLESALLQNPITADNVEQAYLNYLYALDDVANLDIRGTYWQWDATSTPASDSTPDAMNDVLHVFARTNVQQYRYYYRRLLNCSQFNVTGGGSIWTPWEKVAVDISGDHLMPVVWDGRLYLIWPTFAETADPNAQSNVSAPNPGDTNISPQQTTKTLSITLNWSEYRQGSWSSKQTSTASLTPYYWTTYSQVLDPSVFEFSASIGNDDNLTVNVYQRTGNQQGLSYGPPEVGGINTNVIKQPLWAGQFIFSSCQGGPIVQAGSFVASGYPSFPENVNLEYNSLVEWDLGGSTGKGTPYAGQLVLTSAPWTYSTVPATDIPVLGKSPNGYELMYPHQFFPIYGLEPPEPFTAQPFFFADGQRVYFVTQIWGDNTIDFGGVPGTANDDYGRLALTAAPPGVNVGLVFPQTASTSLVPSLASGTSGLASTPEVTTLDATPVPSETFPPMQIVFTNFFHPFVCSLIKTLNRYGLSNLLTLSSQSLTNDNGIISGMDLSSSNFFSSTPNMTPGLLIAQGQLYESVTSPDSNLGPVGLIGTAYLYFTFSPGPTFYYNSLQEPNTVGDAYLGQLFNVSWLGPVEYVSGPTVFEATYSPNTNIVLPDTFPRENIDFSFNGAYSVYNWEIFFHVPLLVATQLSQNQQFADARTWFHYLFNPTISSSDPIPERYWRFLPFYECSPWDNAEGQIQNLFLNPGGDSPLTLCGQDIQDQIAAWRANPFDPFLIGRMRTIAFRMKVVMAYLDNLIAWGDSLFGQNTRESINEATQIYVLAKDILGPRPVQIPQRGTIQDYTYNDLITLFGLDASSPLGAFSNVLVQMENDFPYLTAGSGPAASSGLGTALSLSSQTPYFCFPPNDTLLGYWDTVDDRLYKIRNCMNIQGVVEQLPLFAPPISPALLVAAAAAGVDLASVLSNTNAATPFYRFSFMVQKALELCAEVRSLGASLLSALEKQDAEALALLRATQETGLLQAMVQMKQSAIDEANATISGLQASLTVTQDRQTYYSTLVNNGLSSFESGQISELSQAQQYQTMSQVAELLGSEISVLPNFNLGIEGFGGSPAVTASWGSAQLAAVASFVSRGFAMSASLNSSAATQNSIRGAWDRRGAEWAFQLQLANDEITQIKAQISAANIRLTIAQDDLSNLNLQITNAQAVQDFLTGKYTNTQLYSWMVDQTSTVFFQCYQMAYDLATRAEAAFRFERGLATSSYIQFGYWDSLKKGLMSGERLYADLKRMEIAYLESDVREYEISNSLSLVLFDPWALITLKQTGQCQINLPEAFFDMGYPGHYFRRLKTVNLTIPCVTGPYTSVNCTLTLLNSKLRIDSTASSKQDYSSDAHFLTNYAATQSIATSTAQNDSGMFEVNFRDERYLPFEGAGLISTWQIDMPKDCNAFDFDTITDVVINLRYTSRYGGDKLRDLAKQVAVLPPRPVQSFSGSTTSFPKTQNNLQRIFSLRHEFASEWYKFLHPADTALLQSMSIALGNERFPFQYRGKKIQINQAELVVILRPEFQSSFVATPFSLQLGPPSTTPGSPPGPMTMVRLASVTSFLGGAGYGNAAPAQPISSAPGLPRSWILLAQFPTTQAPPDPSNPYPIWIPATSGGTIYHLNPAAIDDIFLNCQYAAT